MCKKLFLTIVTISLATPVAAAPLPDLMGTARFIRGQIVVVNDNDYNWTNCYIEMNPEDVNFDFVVKMVGLAAHQAVAINAKDFKSVRGRVYSPKVHPPVTLHLVCDIPDGSRGSFETEIR